MLPEKKKNVRELGGGLQPPQPPVSYAYAFFLGDGDFFLQLARFAIFQVKFLELNICFQILFCLYVCYG